MRFFKPKQKSVEILPPSPKQTIKIQNKQTKELENLKVIQKLLEIDEISAIQNKIKEARLFLTKFDLETAKKNYIEMEIN